ncbi:hypothetical protein OUZ56_030442 [Daphnia magna]|uniref:Uncharacterized protein n=1 Tax=Daphnia magna TaxID=35525 RepID=A0ABQ9ZRB4_9CRUS|nr:hypothetical protein OUZ56_030442 [Daphnia magna]
MFSCQDSQVFAFFCLIAGPEVFPAFGQQASMPFSSSVPCKIDHQDSKFYPFFASSSTRLRPSPRLLLARRPVFASSVAPSSPRPSPRLRHVRRPVFATPVAPPVAPPVASWSPRHRLFFVILQYQQ